MFSPGSLFDLAQTEHAALFDGAEFAWDALRGLRGYLQSHVRPAQHGRCDTGAVIGPCVFIGEGTVVEAGAMIQGPAIIGRNCEIRRGAYIRADVIVGEGCVIGNASELKHSLLFNGCQVPHFNYVGDSILGHKAHLGAGAVLSNVKSLAGNVTVDVHDAHGAPLDTGLRKLGAMVGDHAEIGCNAVLNPGSIIGRRAVVYALTSWRGVLPADMIAKNRAPQEVVARRRSGTA